MAKCRNCGRSPPTTPARAVRCGRQRPTAPRRRGRHPPARWGRVGNLQNVCRLRLARHRACRGPACRRRSARATRGAATMKLWSDTRFSARTASTRSTATGGVARCGCFTTSRTPSNSPTPSRSGNGCRDASHKAEPFDRQAAVGLRVCIREFRNRLGWGNGAFLRGRARRSEISQRRLAKSLRHRFIRSPSWHAEP